MPEQGRPPARARTTPRAATTQRASTATKKQPTAISKTERPTTGSKKGSARNNKAALPWRRRGVVWAAVASVVLVGLLFAFVYPTRTFIDQRNDTNNARTQLSLLRSENKRLTREKKLLQSDAEIERRAREFGLVRPGERPFVIIPTPVAPSTTVPAGAAPPPTSPAPTPANGQQYTSP